MSEEETGQEVTKRAAHPLVQAMLDREDDIEAACVGDLRASQLMASLKKAMLQNKKVAECTPSSVYEVMSACAKLGIDPSGEHNSAWLIPYKDRLTLQLGYGGLIDLMTRSGDWIMVETEVVYQGEDFSVLRGTNSRINHAVDIGIRNASESPEADIIAAYAVATHRTGVTKWAVIDQQRIRAARAINSRNGGPWRTNYAAMVHKTAVRELAKTMTLDKMGRLASVLSDEGDGYDTGRRRVDNESTHEELEQMEQTITGEPDTGGKEQA